MCVYIARDRYGQRYLDVDDDIGILYKYSIRHTEIDTDTDRERGRYIARNPSKTLYASLEATL